MIKLYFKNWILFCILCLDYVRNGENEREKKKKKKSGGERKNWYNSSRYNFLKRKIDLELLQCSLDFEKYYSNFKKNLVTFCVYRTSWSVDSSIDSPKNPDTASVGDALNGPNWKFFKCSDTVLLNNWMKKKKVLLHVFIHTYVAHT